MAVYGPGCHPQNIIWTAGADPGFQVRGGALKKIAPSGGRRENCWGISCEKSLFYAKKSYVFQLPREARTFLRYFVWKITILRQKIIFFSNFGGGARRVRPPPESAPGLKRSHLAGSAMNYLLYYTQYLQICQTSCFCYCISKTKKQVRTKSGRKHYIDKGPVNILKFCAAF